MTTTTLKRKFAILLELKQIQKEMELISIQGMEEGLQMVTNPEKYKGKSLTLELINNQLEGLIKRFETLKAEWQSLEMLSELGIEVSEN